MASAGISAWKKYFQNRNVETTVKEDSTLFFEDYTKSSLIIQKESKITVLLSSEYDSKPKILYKDKVYRISFSNISKPNKQFSINLKPQVFGLCDTSITIKCYKTILQSSISVQIQTQELKQYLNLLIDYWSGTITVQNDIQEIYQENSFPINEITKDFGETLGPLACIRHNLINSSEDSKIWIPSKSNEPMMDYKIDSNLISAKSGMISNTVKPTDILKLLENSLNYKKFKNTIEYKVLSKLNNSSAIFGPLLAVKDILGSSFDEWLDAHSYLSEELIFSDNVIGYECEKFLSNESKYGRLNFTKIISESIKDQLTFIKYSSTSSGTGTFRTIIHSDIEKTRPFLRSKNTRNLTKDRLGIQIL